MPHTLAVVGETKEEKSDVKVNKNKSKNKNKNKNKNKPHGSSGSVLGVELPEASRGIVSTDNNQKLISDVDPRDLGLPPDTTNVGVTESELTTGSDDLLLQRDTNVGVSENDSGSGVEHGEASGSGSELKQERVEISEVATIEKVGGIVFNGYLTTGGMKLKSSFIPCSQDHFAKFEGLRKLALSCPQIVTPFQVIVSNNERYLVVEPLETVEDYFNKKFEDFLKENKWKDGDFINLEEKDKVSAMRLWWIFIKEDFITVFRDLVKSLLFLYGRKQKYFCGSGSLRKNIFVSRSSESSKIQAKLLSSMVDSHTFMEDAQQLREIMQSIVFPIAWDFDVEKYCDCPCKEVRHFLRFISSHSYLKDEYVPWMLDHPLLWSSYEKILLMKELARIRKIDQTLAQGLEGCLNTYYGGTNQRAWMSDVKDSLLQAILNKPQYGTVAKYGRTGDAVRFFHACYSHANDYEYSIYRTRYLTEDEIEDKLICTFPKMYIWIKDALLYLTIVDDGLLEVLKILPGIRQ